MTNVTCDVPNCEEPTYYMGWRPLTEKVGKQICEYHWNKHKTNRQYLYDVFGIKKPYTVFNVRKPRPMIKPEKPKEYCTCGKELKQDCKVCDDCAEDKEQWNEELQPIIDDTILRDCPDCHEPKLRPRQRYCDDCRKKRRLKTKKDYQRKFRRLQKLSA